MKIKNKNFLTISSLVFLIFFSIIFNQYHGYIGILPIDSFLIFNSGYDLMNGYYPFKDYWTIKEPFIDLIQAIFFKVFGVSWFSYIFHASIFNCIITVCTFYLLKKFNLENKFCFFYSFCVAILFYPTAGTPFSDHHTLIFCLLSLYCFILAIIKKKKYLLVSDSNYSWIFFFIKTGANNLRYFCNNNFINYIFYKIKEYI